MGSPPRTCNYCKGSTVQRSSLASITRVWRELGTRLERTHNRACPVLTFSAWYHLVDSFGLPLTVLVQTKGKFVILQKFCVTAILLSRFNTTCHHPHGTKTVSPGHCSISNCNLKVKALTQNQVQCTLTIAHTGESVQGMHLGLP